MSDEKPQSPQTPAPKKPAAKKPAPAKPAAKKPTAQKPDAQKPAADTKPNPVTKPIPVVQGKPKDEPAATQPTEVLAPAAAPAAAAGPAAGADPAAAPEPEVVVLPAPKRKRRRWPFVLGGIVLLLVILLVIGYFVGENYAKNYARDYIKQRIIAVLGIDPATPVTVDIGEGSVLFQALAGRLNEVDVTAEEVTFGTLSGAATIHAEGVPLDANAETRELDVTFAVAEEDVVSALSGNLSGLQLDSVALEEPEIVATTSFDFFGFKIPVGMGIVPSAEEGQIVFTPTSIRLGDETYTADELKESFGGFADELLAQQSVCVNENLPVALTIVDVDVVAKDLVLKIDGDGVALGGSDLSTPGTCAS
jgi:hypothetical protein